MDTLLLSRIQFAANISFHILFPTITIALCWLLLFFRLRANSIHGTPDGAAWEQAYYFWTKVFALSFALGVVSGITMSFQFGTNWPGFMERTGNISGPLLGYEVLTAFFLEASFLGIMLFGRNRVSPRMHLVATALVTLGTTLSAFWILSLNSWMQTPAGYEIIDGKFYPTDWWAVVFNPSFPYRLGHVLLASALTASFLVAGLSAWQLLKGTATAGTNTITVASRQIVNPATTCTITVDVTTTSTPTTGTCPQANNTNGSANIIVGHVVSSDLNAASDGDSETSGGDTISFVDGKAVKGDTVELLCDGTNWYARAFCVAFDAITITTAS